MSVRFNSRIIYLLLALLSADVVASAAEKLLFASGAFLWTCKQCGTGAIQVTVRVYGDDLQPGTQRWDWAVNNLSFSRVDLVSWPSATTHGMSNWGIYFPNALSMMTDVYSAYEGGANPGWQSYGWDNSIWWSGADLMPGETIHFGFRTVTSTVKQLFSRPPDPLSDVAPPHAEGDIHWYDMQHPESQPCCGSGNCSTWISGELVVPGDPLNIDSVEVTQSIQQKQSLQDLANSLKNNGEPPVPVVAGKDAALRVYMSKVTNSTKVTVQLSGQPTGGGTISKAQTLKPVCDPDKQRANTNGCKSVDIIFTPPEGSWTATVGLIDPGGYKIQEVNLPFKSRKTRNLVLRAASVCDKENPNGKWLCEPASRLQGKTKLLTKIAPTSRVRVDITNNQAMVDYSAGADLNLWWLRVDQHVAQWYTPADATSLTDRAIYYGMVNPARMGSCPPGQATCAVISGRALDMPSNGAASFSQVKNSWGLDVTDETVAHEVGHALGLPHTGVGAPAAQSPPGCWATAVADGPDWPYADNELHGPLRLEVGFDVQKKKVLDPTKYFELESYCYPRWSTPERLARITDALDVNKSNPLANIRSPQPVTMFEPERALNGKAGMGAASGQYQYWNVSGLIGTSGMAFDPLFVMTSDTAADYPGQGTYKLEVQDSTSAALFDRSFTPMKGVVEDGPSDPGSSTPLTFAENIPVIAGAGRIVLKDPVGIVLGTVTLGGAAPVVTITSPSAGFTAVGDQTVSWTVEDTDSTAFTSRVLYSSDNGLHWAGLGEVSGTSMAVSFDNLGGSNGQSLIRVLVSDGVNTGGATSLNFSVPRKPPQFVQIDSPEPGDAQAAADPVALVGYAYDPDDGMLDGAALQWTSDIQGAIGQGSSLSVTLKPGTHHITLKATDSDGNSATATTSVLIGGAPPVVNLQADVLDQNPSTCVEATISAMPASDGAPLSDVSYSLDGGSTYTAIPLTNLPYKFVVPGSGTIHLVAWANDTSGQGNGQDTVVQTQAVCQQGTPAIQGRVVNKGLQSPGVYFVDVQFTNSGAGLAAQMSIASVVAKVLGGTGTIVYSGPPMPLALGSLAPGLTVTAHLLFGVPKPNTVTRFSLTENGTLSDVFGRSMSFSIGQAIIP
jgi:hypothetical protein